MPLPHNLEPKAFEHPSVAIPRVNDKHKIIEHYDVASPYYYSLWGEHLHHAALV